MLIQLRTIVVEPGHGDSVVASYSESAAVDGMKGLIDRTVMVSKRNKDSEEVVAMIRWESEEDWKNWEKHPVHLEGHRNKRGQEAPSYIISTSVKMYDVKNVIPGTFGKE